MTRRRKHDESLKRGRDEDEEAGPAATTDETAEPPTKVAKKDTSEPEGDEAEKDAPEVPPESGNEDEVAKSEEKEAEAPVEAVVPPEEETKANDTTSKPEEKEVEAPAEVAVPASEETKNEGEVAKAEEKEAEAPVENVVPSEEERKNEDATVKPEEKESEAPVEVAVPASEETKTVKPDDDAPVETAETEAPEAVPVDSAPTPAASESAPSDNKSDVFATTPSEAEAQASGATDTAATPAPVAAPTPAAASSASGLPPGVPSGLPNTPVDPTQPATLTNPDSIVEERGEVTPQYTGRVIGKGGEMIRDLQARSGCRIDVDQDVPAESPRIITYRGTRKAVDFAKQLVATLCSEEGKESDLPLGMAVRRQLVVPSSSIGKIIGRGGEMIRELQARSKAKIQVDHSGAGVIDPSTRQVTITGTDQAVVKAEEMVMFLVANPEMDATESINMLVEDKTHRGGVWGSGPPYPNLPNQGQGMQGQTGYVAGSGQLGYSAPPRNGDGYQPPYGGAYSGYGSSAGGTEMEVFHAAKMYMGRIIGQRGVTINDLQKRSGCDIQINQDVPPGHDCEISLKGPRPGIEMAKRMLREVIELGPDHPYAGGTLQRGGSYAYGAEPQVGGYIQAPPTQSYQYQQPAPYQPAQYGQPYSAPPYQAPHVYGQHERPQYQAPPQQYGMPQQHGMPYQGGMPQQHYGGGYGHQQPMPVPVASAWRAATTGDGQTYYYNEKTGETQWEKPMGM